MIKTILSRIKRTPIWCQEVRINRKDVLEALEFWGHFKIQMPTALKKMRTKLEADPKYQLTLWDQIVIARAILAQIAEKNEAIFQEEMFSDIATEAAESLAQANKHDIW